jgi:hypothetical protein
MSTEYMTDETSSRKASFRKKKADRADERSESDSARKTDVADSSNGINEKPTKLDKPDEAYRSMSGSA